MSDAIVLDKPEQIQMFRLNCIIRGLDMEIRTGMKLARNMPTVRALREQYGCQGRTKQAVLQELLGLYEEVMGEPHNVASRW